MVVRKILETTLTAGQTSVHFTDSDIPLSLIRVYASDPDLLPIERTLSGNTVTVYYEAQSSNVGVALEIVKAGLDIIDDLTSSDATAALSAKQGKVLKDAIDDIVIPTVNDGTLTIQKNGTTVETFTANQSGNVTANISVPTTASDLAYVNTTSGLTADDVQEAIDEVLTDSVLYVNGYDNILDFTQGGNSNSFTIIDPDKAREDIIAFINRPEGAQTPAIAYKTGGFAVGEHFMDKGKFCTAIVAISQGGTLTKNTNYIEGTIADYIILKDITDDLTWNTTNLSFTHKSATRYGNLITINLRFTVLSTVVNTAIITDIPSELMPLSGWYFGQVYEQWNGNNIGNVIFNLGGHNNLYAPESSGYTINNTYTASFTYICKGV